MYIFLGIIVEIATIIGCKKIVFGTAEKIILNSMKKGYKFDINALTILQKKQAEEMKKKGNNHGLKVLLLFIPGVNLLNAMMVSAKLNKAIEEDKEVQETLIPMTAEEKEQYARMVEKHQQLVCAVFFAHRKSEDEKLVGFNGRDPIIVDQSLFLIEHEKLVPLAYTLEEVKKLNAVTSGSYRIGKVDGRNVAIIGISNPNSRVDRVILAEENKDAICPYETMSEEDAQDKKFIVYPFNFGHDEKLQKVIGEIRQDRLLQNQKANSIDSKNTLFLSQNNEFMSPEKMWVEEEKGPVLKKTIF